MTAILSACRPMCGNTSENSSPDCPCLRNRNADLSRLPVSRSDRKSTRLNSSHSQISYAVFCLKKKNKDFDLAIQRFSLLSEAMEAAQKKYHYRGAMTFDAMISPDSHIIESPDLSTEHDDTAFT